MKKKIAIFTFIDAFGYELLKRHSFLDKESKLKKPLTTIFGYSATCDPTIITGALPYQHGHFSFYAYDPKNSPFKTAKMLSILPPFLANRGRVRNQISKFYKKYLGYTGYFQLYNMPFRLLKYFDYTEKKDLYEKDGINSGIPSIFDRLREENVPFYLSDWRKSENYNLSQLKKELGTGVPVFAYLYLAAMDATLHAKGTKSQEVTNKIKWYEQELRNVLSSAEKNYEEVHLYIFSDHGMTDVTETCPLMHQIDKLPLKFGKDYAAVYDSTMARFWFLNKKAKSLISDFLSKQKTGKILSETTLREWGCYFPDGKYGELFFLLNPGILLCPSHMGEKPLAGMHGYSPEDKDSTASFISNHIPKNIPDRLDGILALMNEEIDNK